MLSAVLKSNDMKIKGMFLSAPLPILFLKLKQKSIPVADPGFPRGGTKDANLLFDQFLPKTA